MHTLHFQQRCAPPPFDVDRRVDVGVIGVAAADAVEARLALTVAASGIDHTARRAGLRRESSGHSDHLTAALFHFVGKDRREEVPAHVEDAPVQPNLLADVAAGLYKGTPRAGGHATRVQALKYSDAEALGDVESSALVEVAPDARLPRLEPRDTGLRSPLSVRSTLTPGEDALCVALAGLDPPQAPRHDQHVARGQNERCNHAPVDADHPRARRGRVVRDLVGEGDVPARGIKAVAHILQVAAHRPRVAELDPADLRQAHGAPLAVQGLHRDLAAREAEAVVHAAPAGLREARPAREEVAESTVEVAQGLLPARDVDGPYPVELGAQLCEVGGLSDVAEPVLPTPGRLLLQAEIVDEATHARELPEPGLLLGRRSQLLAEAAGYGHGLFLSPGAHLTNYSRCADAQPPRPEDRGLNDFR
jgi:hypothetical protein